MSLSNYALNERINYLQFEINNLTPPIGGYVPINGNTTINNIKTFSTLPQSSVVPLNNADLVNKLYVDGLTPPIPTFDEVLGAGNSSSNTFILSNGGNANGQSGSQIVLDGSGTFGTASNIINKTSMAILDTDGSVVALNSINNTGMTVNLDDNGVNGTASATIGGSIVGTPLASMGVGCAGVPTSPFPASNAQVSFSATPTTATMGMSQSSPFANPTNLTMDLFGITHNQSVGSPSPNNPFTIETNKYLKLKASGQGGSGFGIFIDPATPNIYYSLSPSTADRIEIDNTGTISSVNVGSQRAMGINYNQVNFSEFGTGSTAELSTLNLNFSGGIGAPTSAFSKSALTLTDTSATGGASSLTSNSLSITDKDAGGTSNQPILLLTNTNTTGSVYTEIYKNKPTAGANGDVLYTQSIYGKDSGNTKQEYTRITHTIRDATAGAEDGSLEMGCFINGTYANFIQLNANDAPIGEVNILRPLDFVGGSDANNTIKCSGVGSNDLNINASTSVGTGHINLTSKTGTVLNVANSININAGSSTGAGSVNITPKAVGGYLILNNLPTSSAGLPAGAVWKNGGVLNIV